VQVKLYYAVLFKNMFQIGKVNHVRKMKHYEGEVTLLFSDVKPKKVSIEMVLLC
jgi:hypothetical protein